MKKKQLKRRINELQSELHESIWYQSQEREAKVTMMAGNDELREALAEKQTEIDDQLLMLANQATTIVKLMKKLRSKNEHQRPDKH